MKFKNLEFSNIIAQSLYQDYLDQVRKATKTYSPPDKEEVLMEINSHIFEAIKQCTLHDELSCLQTIINQLGSPESFLNLNVDENDNESSSQALHSKLNSKIFPKSAGSGIFNLILSICYSIVVFSTIAILVKIFFPDYVGFYYKPGEIVMLGSPLHAAQQYSQYEVLRKWFIPIMCACASIFYLAIYFLEKSSVNPSRIKRIEQSSV